MRALIYLLIGITLSSNTINSQVVNDRKELKQKIKAIMNSGKDESNRPYTTIREIVAGGRDSLDSIVELIQEGEHAGVLLTSLGFLCKPDDKKVITIIESFAYSKEKLFRNEAIDALLRIGDKPAYKLFDKINESDQFEFQLKIIEYCWLLKNETDLLYVQNVLKRVIDDHSNWKISRYIKDTALPRVECVIKILKNKDDPNSYEQLLSILKGKNRIFATVTGGIAKMWAIDKIRTARVPEASKQLREYIDMLDKDKVNIAAHVKKVTLESIKQLGGELGKEEEKWLDENKHVSRPLILLRSVEDLEVK